MAKKKNRAFDIGPEQEIVDGHVVEAPATVINLNEDGVEVVTTAADEVERLTKVNADLTDKIAGYLEEIDKLKIKTDGAREKALQEEVDRLTLRVSELTFENARLKADLAHATQVQEQHSPDSPAPAIATESKQNSNQNISVSKPIKYPCYTNNGYSAWN